jgi:hypothetical protein
MPASLNRPIIFASGPRPKLTARTRSLLARMISTISAAPGWKLWKFTPKLMRRQIAQPGDFLGHFLWAHHRRRQKAERTRIAGRRDKPRLRDPAHRGLDHGNAAAQPSVRGVLINAQPSRSLLLVGRRHRLGAHAADRIADVRSFCACAKWCMWNTASIAAALAAQFLDMVDRLLGQPVAQTRLRRPAWRPIAVVVSSS